MGLTNGLEKAFPTGRAGKLKSGPLVGAIHELPLPESGLAMIHVLQGRFVNRPDRSWSCHPDRRQGGEG